MFCYAKPVFDAFVDQISFATSVFQRSCIFNSLCDILSILTASVVPPARKICKKIDKFRVQYRVILYACCPLGQSYMPPGYQNTTLRNYDLTLERKILARTRWRKAPANLNYVDFLLQSIACDIFVRRLKSCVPHSQTD